VYLSLRGLFQEKYTAAPFAHQQGNYVASSSAVITLRKTVAAIIAGLFEIHVYFFQCQLVCEMSSLF